MCSICSDSEVHARGYCRSCYNKWHYANNREMHSVKNKKWTRENKEYNVLRNKEWVRDNKKRRSQYIKKRYWKNKKELREQEREWRNTSRGRLARAANEARRRARIRSNSTPSQDINVEYIQKTIGCCSYCGSTENLSIEHIVPVAKGGDNSLANLTMACMTCNCSKQDKDLIQWIANNDLDIYDKNIIDKYRRYHAS